MSAEGSAAGSWPLGQALRAYFLAFLPLDEVDDAVRRVGRQAVARGATGVLAVFAIASEVLHAQVRLTPEVEALVLVDESRLLPDEAAMVLGLGPEQVEAVLAEAHAPLDGAPPGMADQGVADQGVADQAGTEPTPAPEPSLPEELADPAEDSGPALAEEPPGVGEAPRAVVEAPPDPELVARERELLEQELAEPERLHPEPGQPGLIEPKLAAAEPDQVGESEPTPRRSRRERSAGPGIGLRARAPVLLGVALAALMAAGVMLTAGQPPDTPAANSRPTASADTAEPSPSATPTAPGVPGLFDLRNAVLTDAVTDGRPGSAETAFTPSQDANLWIAFAYLGSATTDRLGVLWYRGEEVVFRDIFPLDQETGQHISTLAAAAKGDPGRYRADIFVNTQVVATVAFEVGA
jgi:hypothetical protein